MTRPKPARYTVTSFSTELMDTLIKGSRERVEIPCPDQRTMQHIQMRLNMLRGAMFREQHEHYKLVTRARMTRTSSKTDKNKDCVLVIQPNDVQFTDILKRAGIETSAVPVDILDDLDTSKSGASPDTATIPDPYERWKKLK